jgi:hypothetical protein
MFKIIISKKTNKCRIVYLFIIACLLFLVHLRYKPTKDNTQDFFRDECRFIRDRLIAQKWKGECGRKILENDVIIDFELPHMVKVGRRVLFVYEEEEFHEGGEGIYLPNFPERIKISLYHINQFSNDFRSIRFGNCEISRAELIHVLVDELVSASMKGGQFVDGGASKQEEIEAWEFAEDAVYHFYNSDIDISASYSKPQYGENNENYKSVCNYLGECCY